MKRKGISSFEVQAEQVVSLALSICEEEKNTAKGAPNQLQNALSSAAVTMQESIKAFLNIARSLPLL